MRFIPKTSLCEYLSETQAAIIALHEESILLTQIDAYLILTRLIVNHY